MATFEEETMAPLKLPNPPLLGTWNAKTIWSVRGVPKGIRTANAAKMIGLRLLRACGDEQSRHLWKPRVQGPTLGVDL